MEMAFRKATDELEEEYQKFGRYLANYMRLWDILYSKDRAGSILEMMKIHRRQDQKVDKRLALFGIAKTDPHVGELRGRG